MSTIHRTILAAAVLGLVGTSAAQPPPTRQSPTESSEQCPDFVRGAKLGVRNIDGGVALTITTKQRDYVAPLRAMLHELGTIVEQHAQASAASPQPTLAIPPIQVEVKDVPAGVVVRVTTKQPANVAVLRQQAQEVQNFWQASECINGEQHATRDVIGL